MSNMPHYEVQISLTSSVSKQLVEKLQNSDLHLDPGTLLCNWPHSLRHHGKLYVQTQSHFMKIYFLVNLMRNILFWLDLDMGDG